MDCVELGDAGFPDWGGVVEVWVDFRVTRMVMYGYIPVNSRGCSQL